MAKRRVKAAGKKDSLRNKIDVLWKNLVLFLVLFVFSYLLYSISSSALFLNLFGTLAILFGFISFALLLVLMVFLVLRASRR